MEDCHAGLLWAARRYASLPLVIAGDSAGGNFAAALTHMVRDAHHSRLGAQVLIYPVVDCAMDTASHNDPENQLLLTKRDGQWAWQHYMPAGTAWSDPHASVLRSASSANLPPALVVLAGQDILRDEGEEYARRLAAGGTACDVFIAEGEIHGYFVGGALPGAAVAMNFIATGLDRIFRAASQI